MYLSPLIDLRVIIVKVKKSIVCVFAHPDDEAFGPSGTIYKLARNNDIYILCATKGQAGQDSKSEKSESLAKKRAKELTVSAKILGVKKVYFLGFRDGTLCNNLYHKLATKIQSHLEKLKPHTLITFEHHGISGHIDHITVSMVTTFVFYKLPFIRKIMYHCILKERAQTWHDYFIYFPPGYDRSEVDLIVDVQDAWDIKVRAMQAHESQMQDTERIIKSFERFSKEEYFMILKK